jgi:drug/metabolite transporter (DMT)-like permease
MAANASTADHQMAANAGTADHAGRDRTLIVAAALTSVALWSSAFVGIRFAGRELDPGPLALGRLLVGSIALGVAIWPTRPLCRPAARCSERWPAACCGSASTTSR